MQQFLQFSPNRTQPTSPTPNLPNPVKLGELFCGAGGMALGASAAKHGKWRYTHVWGIDKDKDSCSTIQQIIPSNKVHHTDIQNISFHTLPPIDGLVFGFPCNDFSAIGKQAGIQGTHGRMYQYGTAALTALRPLFFVAENVSGIASANQQKDWQQILQELSNIGYTLTVHHYRFEEYGIPQKRHRYIIVGFRNDLHMQYSAPEPSGKQRTAADALSDIPDWAANHQFTSHSPVVKERLSYIRPGENIWTADVPSRLQYNMRSNAKISSIWRRLVADEPAYTVTAKGGGGTSMYHWSDNRQLTNRERARLQTFPDWYKFEGGVGSVRRQIGMAVPPDGAQIVFESILQAFTICQEISQ